MVVRGGLIVAGLAAAAAVLGASGSAAEAGILAANPNSMPAFTGTRSFTATSGANTLHVLVDYAVYAPGTYGGTLGGAADPSGGTDYVYAYQAANDAGSTLPLSALTVTLAGAAAGAHDAGVNGALGGTNPALELIQSTSFFNLFSPNLSPGQNSSVILFTSPNAPVFGAASVADGGVSDQQSLPTPLVPEPASVGVAMAGGVALAGMRRRRSK